MQIQLNIFITIKEKVKQHPIMTLFFVIQGFANLIVIIEKLIYIFALPRCL